jgi:uncharacterized protein (TIRG00374 family)
MQGAKSFGCPIALDSSMSTESFTKERWLPLLFGAACLGTVVLVVQYYSEEQAFVQLTRQANPVWMVAALALQAVTYLAQGEIWRRVGKSSGSTLPVWAAYRLALIKLFIDQALPSAGYSGAVVVARMLLRHMLRRSVVSSILVITATSFFFAYVASLLGALVILSYNGHAATLMTIPAVVFMVSGLALAAAMIVLSGRDLAGELGRFGRFAVVQSALSAMKEAERDLARNARLQLRATFYQVATFVLDGLTLWMLLRSLGVSASPAHVFASFMISSLIRTIGFIPGGLGTFEATAVLMLKMDGISPAAALAATVLFRLVTFVLPMVPGLWFSRHLVRHHHHHPHSRRAA